MDFYRRDPIQRQSVIGVSRIKSQILVENKTLPELIRRGESLLLSINGSMHNFHWEDKYFNNNLSVNPPVIGSRCQFWSCDHFSCQSLVRLQQAWRTQLPAERKECVIITMVKAFTLLDFVYMLIYQCLVCL